MTDPGSEPGSGHRAPRTSEVLRAFADDVRTPLVSIGEVADGLGDRGLGVLIAIFALPNLIPSAVPLGSAIFGIPIIVFAAQLVRGVRHIWLPGVIKRRTMDVRSFRIMVSRLTRVLSWFEGLLKPRLLLFTVPRADRAVGACSILFAIVTSLPIPFGHNLPALALVLIGLGLIESDGLAILLGLIIGFAGLVVAGLLLFGLFHGASFLMHYL